jgi:hypothetical protein
MQQRPDDRSVLVVRHNGELDEPATRRLVEEVRERTTSETALIVLSLTNATAVHWDALCGLARATQVWRAAHRSVILKGARPSLRAALASVDGPSTGSG